MAVPSHFFLMKCSIWFTILFLSFISFLLKFGTSRLCCFLVEAGSVSESVSPPKILQILYDFYWDLLP